MREILATIDIIVCIVHTATSFSHISDEYCYPQRADLNGDGLLTAEEYYHILADHGVECSRDEIKEILRLADQDHDG